MNDLTRIVRIIMRIWMARADRPSTCVLGEEYERRDARRSAIWVLGGLVFLFLIGWLLWHWIVTS